MNTAEFKRRASAKGVQIDAAGKGSSIQRLPATPALVGVSRESAAVAVQYCGFFGGAKGDILIIPASEIRNVKSYDQGMFNVIEFDRASYGDSQFQFNIFSKRERDDLYSKISFLIT